MSLYQKAVAGLLFPLHEKLKGHDTIAVHKAMERSQWLAPEAMAQLQLDNLRRFLTKIGRTVPYYQKLFADLGFNPEGVTSVADLHRLPLLDKAAIRAHTEQLKAQDVQGLKRFNTGGSSCEPLIFYLGNERVSHDVAAKRRATRWWGVDIGDREIVVWGSPIELGSQDRVRLLRDKLFRTELLSAFEMSQANLQKFVERIRQFRPKMLFGYPSSLALIAQFAGEQGIALDGLGIRVAFVTSERLYEHQREAIENAFGCPVANGYGGRDAGFIAHACPAGSLHITAEDMVVEIVDPAGNVLPAGESGEIVVTHLFTSEFPFVRYRTGDVGTLSDQPCTCGRGQCRGPHHGLCHCGRRHHSARAGADLCVAGHAGRGEFSYCAGVTGADAGGGRAEGGADRRHDHGNLHWTAGQAGCSHENCRKGVAPNQGREVREVSLCCE